MILFLSILVIILFVALIGALLVIFRYGKIIMNVEDNLEDCVNWMNVRYDVLTKVFENLPGFEEFDPNMNRFFEEAQRTRRVVISIANTLGTVVEEPVIDISDEEESIARINERINMIGNYNNDKAAISVGKEKIKA